MGGRTRYGWGGGFLHFQRPTRLEIMIGGSRQGTHTTGAGEPTFLLEFRGGVTRTDRFSPQVNEKEEGGAFSDLRRENKKKKGKKLKDKKVTRARSCIYEGSWGVKTISPPHSVKESKTDWSNTIPNLRVHDLISSHKPGGG